jgi:transcriptional regulator with XRE-family HTH domain
MNNNIVTIINELCDTNKISIGQLEKELKFSQGLISRWDKSSPSVDKIVAVADYFHVPVDYVIGRSMLKSVVSVEELFIDKIIKETESYSLPWAKYTGTNMSLESLEDCLRLKVNWGPEPIHDVKCVYELKYHNSCIYYMTLVQGSALEYLLLMQMDVNSNNYDNTIPITSLSDTDKIRKFYNSVKACIKNYELANKHKAILQTYISDNSKPEDEYISYAHIVNNLVTNLPGFVLDGRVGATIWNKIIELEKQIKELQKSIPT